MYGFRNEEILREVDSFIAQAKLQGEISDSSLSNISLNIQSPKTKNKDETNQIRETDETIRNSTNKDEFDKKPATADCFIECETSNIISKPEQDENIICSNQSIQGCLNDDDSAKDLKFGDKPSPINNREIQQVESFCAKGEDENCDSSFVDFGSDSNRSSVPYVMWLQQKRSTQNYNHNTQEERDDRKISQREDVHFHQVNSALFWERWIDHIFEMYDQWVESSDSEEDRKISRKTYSDFGKLNKPTKTKSEPVMRVQSDDSMKTNNLKFKSPSYVNWLMHRRQAATQLSDSEEIIESKINNNYWSSLYGKLTKSFSSIFSTAVNSSGEGERLSKGDNIGTSSCNEKTSRRQNSELTKQTKLRRSQSQPCSHSHSVFNHSKLRYRQLSQESVGSPVLTDQLVELVCNTLSPGSSSSEDETL